MAQIFAIDLGSGYTRAGAVLDGVISIIPLKNEDKSMPSVVSFRNGKRLVGVDAKKTVPDNIIFDSCRIYLKDRYAPCFSADNDGSYKIRQHLKSEEPELITRQEAISTIINHVKIQYEKKTQSPAQRAVITIPDFATQHHKKIILQSAMISGLRVPQLLPQSTAAAIFYNLNNPESHERTFLVFNFGAGSISVAIFSKKNGHTQLVSCAGSAYVGGEDITNLLMHDLVKALKESTKQDLYENKKNLVAIRESCETGKFHISNFYETKINFELVDEKSYNYKLSRTFMENIAKNFFSKIESIFLEALTPIKTSNLQIEEVLLVGGSTRIPKIKEIIQKHLPTVKFDASIVAEEAVVRGAAIKASILNENTELAFADVEYAPMMPIYCSIKNSYVRVNVVGKIERVPSVLGNGPILELPNSDMPIEVMPFAVFENGGDYIGALRVKENSYLSISFKLNHHGILQTWVTKYPHGTPEKVQLYNPNQSNKRPHLLTTKEVKAIQEKMNPSRLQTNKIELKEKNKNEEEEIQPSTSGTKEYVMDVDDDANQTAYANEKNRETLLADAMKENNDQNGYTNLQPMAKVDTEYDQEQQQMVQKSEEPLDDSRENIRLHYDALLADVKNNLKNIAAVEKFYFCNFVENRLYDLYHENECDHNVACQQAYDWHFVLKFKSDVIERIADILSLVQELLGFEKYVNNERLKDAIRNATENLRLVDIDMEQNHIAQIQEEFLKFDMNFRHSLMADRILLNLKLNKLLEKPEPI